MKDLFALFSFWGQKSTLKEAVPDGKIGYDAKSESQKIYQKVTQFYDETTIDEILQNESVFKKMSSASWISAGKQNSELFEKILQTPALAQWTNNFPPSDPKGLLMIATFSKTHILIAKEYGEEVISEDDMRTVDQFIDHNAFSYCAKN